jgi:hypothetical protein
MGVSLSPLTRFGQHDERRYQYLGSGIFWNKEIQAQRDGYVDKRFTAHAPPTKGTYICCFD